MKYVIVLKTAWSKNYWEESKKAPYHRKSFKELQNWEEFKKSLPLPGIGIYIKQKVKGKINDFTNKPFVYLKIKRMEYNESEEPFFDFEPIASSKIESKKLLEYLSFKNQLFFSIKFDKIIKILEELGEEPPKEWKLLLNRKEEYFWKDCIGKYFLDIENKDLSNEEFEHRIAELLKAIGFRVIKRGYKSPGEYPDGVAWIDNNHCIVYDCKNRAGYYPTAEDKRAIKKYVEDEKKRSGEKKKYYPVFIAKTISKNCYVMGDIFCITVESLLYLLYKKLCIGSPFTLNPVKVILDNKKKFSIETIENEWKL